MVPKNYIELEIKQLLHEDFDIKKNLFSGKLKIINMFKSIVFYFLTFFWIIIFSKSSNKKKIKCDLIIDQIEHEGEAQRLHMLAKKFKPYLYISKVNLDKKYNFLSFNSMKGYSRKLVFSIFFKYIFNFFFFTLKNSILYRTNFFIIVLHILKRVMKYESLFSQIDGKYLFQERHFATSAIKNFLFKKHGGKTTSCTQRDITVNSITGYFYLNTDILFSIGNKTALPKFFPGSKIKNIIPVGSIAMESEVSCPKKIEG